MKKYKLITLIVLLIIVIAGSWYVYSDNVEPRQYTDPAVKTNNQNSQEFTYANDTLDITFSYDNNAYKYTGIVQKPTPCHEVSTEVVIRESYPEQVDLNVDIDNTDQICAQVIEEEEISGEIPVSKDATIQVYLNGELVQ